MDDIQKNVPLIGQFLELNAQLVSHGLCALTVIGVGTEIQSALIGGQLLADILIEQKNEVCIGVDYNGIELLTGLGHTQLDYCLLKICPRADRHRSKTCQTFATVLGHQEDRTRSLRAESGLSGFGFSDNHERL